tara:strand:+ start:264 stop:596 length:333 start_codon:yes stop_codon:yes gene_type:complete
MEKFLYFSVDGTTQAIYPVSAFRGIEVDTNLKLNLYFTPLVDAGQDTTADENDKIILTCGADEKAAAKVLVEAIKGGPHGPDFLVVADSLNSVFLANSTITACDSIAYAG